MKLKATVPYGLYGIEQYHLMVTCSFVLFGTNTGGRISSSGGGSSHQGTATVVRAFLVFCEGACSDNMGNKESNVGIFSFSHGINLSMFPIVEEVKEVFLLYHMKRIPMTMVHIPVSTNRAKISFGDIENG